MRTLVLFRLSKNRMSTASVRVIRICKSWSILELIFSHVSLYCISGAKGALQLSRILFVRSTKFLNSHVVLQKAFIALLRILSGYYRSLALQGPFKDTIHIFWRDYGLNIRRKSINDNYISRWRGTCQIRYRWSQSNRWIIVQNLRLSWRIFQQPVEKSGLPLIASVR